METSVVEDLYQKYGDADLSKSLIIDVLKSNNGDINAALPTLLSFKQTSPKPVQTDLEKSRKLQQLHSKFGDLSLSFISDVYDQNQGDYNKTTRMLNNLVNVYSDEESLEQIRQLDQEQKNLLEISMTQETKNIRQRTQQKMHEEMEHLKVIQQQDQARRLKEKQEMELLQKELLIKEQKLRDEAQKIQKLRLIEKEKEDEKRHLNEENLKQKELVLQMQQQMQDLQFKIKQQEHEFILQELEMKRKEQKLVQFQEAIEQIEQEQSICTLSVRYTQNTIVVAWSISPQQITTTSDWIGFFPIDSKSTQYIEYIQTKGARQGSHHFQTPKTPGLFEFRFFLNGSYDDVVRSGVIHLGPQLSLSAEMLETKIKCTWSLTSGDLSPKDWIGFYSVSENRRISKHNISPTTSVIMVEIPRRPGEYEFRFVPYLCGKTAVAKSNSIVVQNSNKLFVEKVENNGRIELRVTWDIRSDDISNSDWIAVYALGKQDNDYVTYKYLDTIKNMLIFDAPPIPGEYELRFHLKSQSKYTHLVASNSFVIEETNSLVVTVEQNCIKVSSVIRSIPVSLYDWIGFYKEGAVPTNYISYKYVDLKNGFVTFEQPANRSGKYFARYFSNSLPKYSVLTQSNVITM